MVKQWNCTHLSIARMQWNILFNLLIIQFFSIAFSHLLSLRNKRILYALAHFNMQMQKMKKHTETWSEHLTKPNRNDTNHGEFQNVIETITRIHFSLELFSSISWECHISTSWFDVYFMKIQMFIYLMMLKFQWNN